MTGFTLQRQTRLPDEAHVVRCVKRRLINDEDGSVDGSAFRLRDGEHGLSVNWLERFDGMTKEQQVDEVRRLIRLKLSRRLRFAELQVGVALQHVRQEYGQLSFVHAPLAAEGEYEADESHSEVAGLPPGDSERGALVGDLIAGCVQRIHFAVVE